MSDNGNPKYRPGLAGAIVAVIGKRWPTVNEQRYVETHGTAAERREYDERMRETRRRQGR